MSISSVGGASSAGSLNQLLASMLSRIQEAQAGGISTAPASTTSADPSQAAPDNALTGTDASTLSDRVLNMLVMMQGQSQSGDASGSGTANAGSTLASTDPLQQAFASIDSNGDGAISQSELETTIENAGGTASQADAVYTALGGTDTNGISPSQFASDVQAGAPQGGQVAGMHGHHHHHHHGGGGQSATDAAAQIFSALDSNDDGSVSPDELSAALGGVTGSTAAGSGTASDATTGTTTGTTAVAAAGATGGSSSSSIFSAIDSNGDGSISQTELSAYLTSLQQQIQTDQSTLNGFSSLVNQSYNNALSLMSPEAMSQMAWG